MKYLIYDDVDAFLNEEPPLFVAYDLTRKEKDNLIKLYDYIIVKTYTFKQKNKK